MNTCSFTILNAKVKICTLISDVPVLPGTWMLTGWVPSEGLGYTPTVEIDGCCVSVAVTVPVEVFVGVALGTGVPVNVGVGVSVGILVFVGFGVLVRVAVGIGVQLQVAVALGVALGISVAVDVGVYVAWAIVMIAPITGKPEIITFPFALVPLNPPALIIAW